MTSLNTTKRLVVEHSDKIIWRIRMQGGEEPEITNAFPLGQAVRTTLGTPEFLLSNDTLGHIETTLALAIQQNEELRERAANKTDDTTSPVAPLSLQQWIDLFNATLLVLQQKLQIALPSNLRVIGDFDIAAAHPTAQALYNDTQVQDLSIYCLHYVSPVLTALHGQLTPLYKLANQDTATKS